MRSSRRIDIEEFSSGGRDLFFRDALIQSGILHRLALLGEACRGVSSQLREGHPEVPWTQIIAFRNVVLHQYFGADLELVWQIVVHLPPFRSSLERIAESLAE